jgi:hypothetical protein
VVQFIRVHGFAKYLLSFITKWNGSSLLTHIVISNLEGHGKQPKVLHGLKGLYCFHMENAWK